MKRISVQEIVIPLLVALLFLGSSYISGYFADDFRYYVASHGVWGMLFYILITTIIIVAPFATSIPLIPVAVTFWGSFAVTLLTLAGWFIGAVITFLLGRCYGKPLLRYVTALKNIERYGQMIPHHHLFLTVIFLRLGGPVDIVSYAVGLFTRMEFFPYVLSSLIGLSVFSIFLSYTSALAFDMQALVIGVASVVGFLLYLYMRSKAKQHI